MQRFEHISGSGLDYWIAGMRLGEGQTGNLWYLTPDGWVFGPVGYRAALHFDYREEAQAATHKAMLLDGRPEVMAFRGRRVTDTK